MVIITIFLMFKSKTNQVEIRKTFLKDPTDLLEMKIIMSEIENIQYEFNKLHTEKYSIETEDITIEIIQRKYKNKKY